MSAKTPRKPHFDYLAAGLQWTASQPHDYVLKQTDLGLQLQAQVQETTLGRASTVDHLIWDEIVEKGSSRRCECLTLWTQDLEFNILIFGSDHRAETLVCAYFTTPEPGLCIEHLTYWRAIKLPQEALPIGLDLTHIPFQAESAEAISVLLSRRTAENICRLLPRMVVWNRYEKNGDRRDQTVRFTRQHAVTFDHFRQKLQTMPLPTRFLDEGDSLSFGTDPKDAANKLYRLVLERYDSVAGCGSAMQRNLLTLASLLVDPNIKTLLVTGEPGTGKENLCKAIYYGNKLRRLAFEKDEAIFISTTAPAIQAAISCQKFSEPCEFLRDQLKKKSPLFCRSSPKRPVILIDELNKAGQGFLATMLRPLEQGDVEIGCDGDPKFILAASQHIDDLAKEPPQDFWTRVSHQLRVVHPLSRVSEKDGEAFLEAFFYNHWWALTQTMVTNYTGDSRVFIKTFVGEVSRTGSDLTPSPLCDVVREAFLNALVPLVCRDTLSVRGARSILSQVFARISWYVRFEAPMGDPMGPEIAKRVARLVNNAVQDVMGVLNAARATPAAMAEGSHKQ